jgi:hypothetical protein
MDGEATKSPQVWTVYAPGDLRGRLAKKVETLEHLMVMDMPDGTKINQASVVEHALDQSIENHSVQGLTNGSESA